MCACYVCVWCVCVYVFVSVCVSVCDCVCGYMFVMCVYGDIYAYYLTKYLV